MNSNTNPLAGVEKNINSVLLGKPDVVRKVVICLLCRGHILLEDVPGTGKTVCAKALAHSLAGVFRRIQFTPDLLPADVTGSNIYNQQTGKFEFLPGPIFANILLADEINRTTPRSQSALLEAMEEKQVTVDGTTYTMHEVFLVVATQNPIEQQGTFPLPEAQLDRFFMRLSIGYPATQDELAVLDIPTDHHPVTQLSPVVELTNLVTIQNQVESIQVQRSIKYYILKIVHETRIHGELELGVSPRGAIALRKAAQGKALLEGRDFVTPDDVKLLAADVLAHRIIVKPQARIAGRTDWDIITEIVNRVAVPIEYEPGA